MNIVLQSKSDLSYVASLPEIWTKDGERAQVFANGLEALFYCFDRQMKNMQMVARFTDPIMNFSVPVADVSAT
jgi:hypothetical protein